MPKYRIEIKGVDEVQRKFGSKSAHKLRQRVENALEEGIRDMAEDSFQLAPKDTTALAHSIVASVKKEAPLTWYYGSNLPYAQRQEYEHKSKKGYFRRSVNTNKILLKDRLDYIVESHFR